MNFPKYLSILKSKNETLFKAEKIIITIASFEGILRCTYECGYKESEQFYSDLNKMTKNKDNDGLNAFKDIFGGFDKGK